MRIKKPPTAKKVKYDSLGCALDGIVYGIDQAPMTYTYNLSGALVQETYPSGRVVKNEFESDGDLARIMSRKGNETILRP